MFTIFATTAYLLSSITTKAKPAKVEAATEVRPDYMQRVDAHVEALFTPAKIEEYKRLGLM